jgi:hypothetical protein
LVLPISGLFLMAQAMAVVTSDTTVLSQYFMDNRVVCVFFISVTAAGTAVYAILLVWRLVSALCRSRTTLKHVYVAYGVAAFIALGQSRQRHSCLWRMDSAPARSDSPHIIVHRLFWLGSLPMCTGQSQLLGYPKTSNNSTRTM